MNPMSLPRATQFTIGALGAALFGWGGLIYSTASHNDAEEQWAQERTALDGQVAELAQTGKALEAQAALMVIRGPFNPSCVAAKSPGEWGLCVRGWQ